MRSLCSGLTARRRHVATVRASAVVVMRSELDAGHARPSSAVIPSSLGDRRGRPRMVAGDHHARMPASWRARRGSPRRAAGRSCRPARGRRVLLERSSAPLYASALGSHARRPRASQRPPRAPRSSARISSRARGRAAGVVPAAAARCRRQEHVGRALGEDHAACARRRGDRAHQLALRRERHLVDPRRASGRARRLAGRPRGDQQRALGRIAVHVHGRPAPADRGVGSSAAAASEPPARPRRTVEPSAPGVDLAVG